MITNYWVERQEREDRLLAELLRDHCNFLWITYRDREHAPTDSEVKAYVKDFLEVYEEKVNEL